jgi:hypothetical protein
VTLVCPAWKLVEFTSFAKKINPMMYTKMKDEYGLIKCIPPLFLFSVKVEAILQG